MSKFLLLLIALLSLCSSYAFTASPISAAPLSLLSINKRTPTSTRLYFFGQPKDDGSPGDYVCKDCGYVFTKGPKAWAELPDNYSCPPCGAPKRRFKKVPKGDASGKVEIKKMWK